MRSDCELTFLPFFKNKFKSFSSKKFPTILGFVLLEKQSFEIEFLKSSEIQFY